MQIIKPEHFHPKLRTPENEAAIEKACFIINRMSQDERDAMALLNRSYFLQGKD